MASNEYVNKVVLAGGNTLIDLTSDTAVAADVASGKYFHLASGERVQGSCTYDSDTTDANATAGDIAYGKTAYVNKNKITGSMPVIGAQTITISGVDDEISISAGSHDGSGKAKLDATEKAKIIAGNIKSGVEILGVEGTYTGEGVTATSVSVTPYFDAQTILPPSGYDYISQVNVAAIAVVETDNAAGGKTVTVGTATPE